VAEVGERARDDVDDGLGVGVHDEVRRVDLDDPAQPGALAAEALDVGLELALSANAPWTRTMVGDFGTGELPLVDRATTMDRQSHHRAAFA
jgi:hypothetical protein